MPTLEAVATAGTGILLIEQFAPVALERRPRVRPERGVIRDQGSAQEMKDNPERLHSAYLLRIAAEPSVG